jgi:hypothetical protein
MPLYNRGAGKDCTMRRLWLCVAALLLAGCVGPARTFEAYEGKAASTADAMRSAVATAALAAHVAEHHRGFSPYLTIAIADAGMDATGIQGGFDSVLPPDHAADRLRDQLDGLLSAAVTTIVKLGFAARHRDVASFPALAAPLQRLRDQLEAFSKAHS